MQNILAPPITKNHKKLFFLCILAIGSTLFCSQNYDDLSKEEGFMLRRITEFARDQEYDTVKKEIKIFLETHKDSPFCDQLKGNYGDLYIQEGDYKNALSAYNQINNQGVLVKFVINKMQCLYELEQYSELITCGAQYLSKMSKELLERKDEFYFLMAEGYFRQGISAATTGEKDKLLDSAMPLYEKILNSSFNDPTMFALAEIYRLKSTNKKAQSFFLELAKRHPDRKEELLFHAAISQAEFDKELAVSTFTEIISMNGEKKKDAILNRLILFFQQEDYDSVIKNFHNASLLVENEQKMTLNYIIARSYFAKKDYEGSSKILR